jgi:hypothetical protein
MKVFAFHATSVHKDSTHQHRVTAHIRNLTAHLVSHAKLVTLWMDVPVIMKVCALHVTRAQCQCCV